MPFWHKKCFPKHMFLCQNGTKTRVFSMCKWSFRNQVNLKHPNQNLGEVLERFSGYSGNIVRTTYVLRIFRECSKNTPTKLRKIPEFLKTWESIQNTLRYSQGYLRIRSFQESFQKTSRIPRDIVKGFLG